MTPWIKLLVTFWQHEKILDLPNDAARWSWLVLLSLVKEKDGTFGSEAQLRTLMGARYKWVTTFRDLGLLNDLTVHNWEVHQVNPDRSRDRMKRLRDRRKASDGGSDASQPRHVTEGDRDRDRDRDRDEALTTVLPRQDERESWNRLKGRLGRLGRGRDGDLSAWIASTPYSDELARQVLAKCRNRANEKKAGHLNSLDLYALTEPESGKRCLLQEVAEDQSYARHLAQHEALKADAESPRSEGDLERIQSADFSVPALPAAAA